MTTPVVSADQICVGVETVLREHLAATVDTLGWTERLGTIREWQQLPVTDAIATAKLPAIAVTTGGIVGAPTTTTSGTRATWGIAVGLYARGRTHAETQAKVRDWCAATRSTVLAHKSLGGIAISTKWIGERFDLFPSREDARTFGAGVISFDVEVRMALDPTIDAGGLPTVLTTPTTLSVQSPQ
ncbi:hypothetical protein GCM10028801_41230 [Nocardioides maradonensis]